jgi:predicted amidohydrolase
MPTGSSSGSSAGLRIRYACASRQDRTFEWVITAAVALGTLVAGMIAPNRGSKKYSNADATGRLLADAGVLSP